jgi:hypothetical protein
MASVQWFPTEILKDDQLDFLLPTSSINHKKIAQNVTSKAQVTRPHIQIRQDKVSTFTTIRWIRNLIQRPRNHHKG